MLQKSDKITIAGIRFDGAAPYKAVALPGKSLEAIVMDALQAMRREGRYTRAQARELMRYSAVRVNGIVIQRKDWSDTVPPAGAFIEIRRGLRGGGGGGGKSVVGTIIGIVAIVGAAIVAPIVGPALAAGLGVFSATTWTGIVAGGFMLLGAAANMLFPAAQPKISMPSIGDIKQESPTYSLTGARNAANPYGYVPLVLGKHRHTPPLVAKNWTSWEGDDQFFHMAVAWGHAHMHVTDFRIGETALESFKDIEHVFHASTTGDDLKLFAKSYNEQNVGAKLKQTEGWTTRSIGEAEDISIDLSFQNGLCTIDKNSGDQNWRTIKVKIEYSPTGEDVWKSFVRANQFDITGGESGWLSWFRYRKYAISCNEDGKLIFGSSSGKYQVYPNKNEYISCSVRVEEQETEPDEYGNRATIYNIIVSDGEYNDGGYIHVSDYRLKYVVKNYRITGLPKKNYDVRARRITGDTDSQYIKDECTWSVVRAILNQPAFNSPVPLCVSELRIRASEQLSQYVDDFNGLAVSVVPDWDEASGTWVERETSNPASLARFCITSRAALSEPYSLAKLDDTAWQEFWRYCDQNGYRFDFICDSEEAFWQRMTEVIAPGRGGFVVNEGRFMPAIDRTGLVPVQMFTPRNSWGMKVSRDFYDLPHALRVSFVDETRDYERHENFVYADGYNKDNATNIIEWEFPGVTSWERIWRQGRYYLAKLLQRPLTLTFSTDWEWLACRRGDLVCIASPVLLNTFGTARIDALLYNVDGQRVAVRYAENAPQDAEGNPLPVIGVRLDDTVIFSQSGRYGIAIRDNAGKLTVYEVQPQIGSETRDMVFMSPLSAGNTPEPDQLVSVSILGDEYAEYLVAAIRPGEKLTAEITCIPYNAEEIEAATKGAVPPWEPPTYLPGITGDALPVPKIAAVKSDESMLIRQPGGGLITQIGVWWRLSTAVSGNYVIQAQAISENSGDVLAASCEMTDSYVTLTNGAEGETYNIRVRLVAANGKASAWSDAVTHTVIGKTLPPPDVEGFTAAIESPAGIRLTWQAVNVLDVDRYRITGPVTIETTATSIIAVVTNRTGAVDFQCVAVDTGGRVSETPATASVEILPPAAPAGFRSDTRNDGLYLVWDDCDTTWPVQHYIITDDYLGTTSKELRTQTVISPRAVGSYNIDVQAVDIFGNAGERVAHELVVQQPSTPVVTTEVNNGVVRLKWPAVESSFPVKTYQVFSVNGQLLQETNATFFDINGPAGTLKYRVRAVDSAGNMSAFGEVVLELTAPEAPQVTVALNKNRDGLDLTWTVPNSMLPVLTYDVVRQWTENGELMEQDYGSTDATAMSIPATPAGQHTFLVRAVDASGNRSVWGADELTVRNPGPAFLTDVNVIDNNVQVYWQEPTDLFFAIAYYNFGTLEDGHFSLIGRIDARFASRFEREAGEYTYQICPVDVAGNVGQCSNITAQVAQPPDFVFFDDRDSTFNGELVNASLDGRGSMIMPVYPDETWQENIDRVAGLLKTAPASLTWQQKINGGYPAWQSPPAPSATYTEIVDVGTDVPSTSITVTVTSRPLEGNPLISCKIEVSSNRVNWREMADGSFQTYASSFRYVRYTLTVTGGMAAISAINYRLDVKKQSDFGAVFSSATDNGEGFTSVDATPDLYGTWVPFLVSFTDIQSGPIVFCNEEGKTAYVNFKDTLHPTGFRVYVLNRNGQRVDGQVSWSAFGV